MESSTSLFLLSLLFLCLSSECADVGPNGERTYIYIRNDFIVTLGVRCVPRDWKAAHLPEQTLLPGQSWGFDFIPEFRVEWTRYDCSFWWPGKLAHFMIYREQRELRTCKSRCYWSIRPDGPRVYTDEARQTTPWIYKWDQVEEVPPPPRTRLPPPQPSPRQPRHPTPPRRPPPSSASVGA